MRSKPQDCILDPVVAYDRIAPAYRQISDQRRPYLDSVDRQVLRNIPEQSRSFLDVGAGDGRRAFRLAREAEIDDLVLLEPSRQMQRLWSAEAEGWTLRAEELAGEDRRFDVITCLWNVLGHVPTRAARTAVLHQFGKMLSPSGVLFLDVNHRYNVRSYGLLKTAARYFYDRAWPSEANGDVKVTWSLNGSACATTGHVFTKPEILRMADAAGLKLQECMALDYSTGEIRSRLIEGHLLFIFRRS